jgi:hypothetical protein
MRDVTNRPLTLILIMVSVPFIAGFALGWGLRSVARHEDMDTCRLGPAPNPPRVRRADSFSRTSQTDVARGSERHGAASGYSVRSGDTGTHRTSSDRTARKSA